MVEEYAVTARFRANDTVRFYAVRVISTNEFLFMGKDYLPPTFDPSTTLNQFLGETIP